MYFIQDGRCQKVRTLAELVSSGAGGGERAKPILANIFKATFNSLAFMSISCFDVLMPDACGKEESNWTHLNRDTDDI